VSLVREIRILTRRLVETERRMAQMVLPGRVAVVDHDKRRLRLEIGKADDGAAILSPWVRWPEASTGTLKVHVPPPIGTPMTLISPSGTVGAGSIAQWGAYTDADAAPSKASDAAVIAFGDTVITIQGDRAAIETAKLSIKADVEIEGDITTTGSITNNGVRIDSTHVHSGVLRGGERTNQPI
jgi:phage baseplate assembly protein gpV